MAEIRCLLNQTVEISKQQPAVIDDNRVVTYQELENYVATMAHHLRARGVVEGERVVLLMLPGWRQIAALLALIRIKAVACPLSTRLPEYAMLQQMRQVSARTVISDLAEQVGEVPALHPDLLLEFVPKMEADKPQHDLKQPAVIVFTSGSSGASKPALISYGALYYSCRGANIHLQLSSNDKWLLSIPLYHVGGMGVLFRCLESGATVVVAKPGAKLQEEIELYEATHISLVPTQLVRLLDLPDAREIAASLRIVLVGGAPASTERLQEAIEKGFPVHATYGLTEMASQVTTVPKYYPADKLGTSGKLLPNREIAVAEDGEILVRGETLFSGYVNGDEVHLPVDENGWFATGDLGSMDEDGYLTVLGRKDTMFISGGENIHPEEIEQVLTSQAEALQAVVVPQSDEEFGSRPVAFIETASPLNAAHLSARLEEFLPRFKIPVAFYPWPKDVPTHAKVDRAWFAEQL